MDGTDETGYRGICASIAEKSQCAANHGLPKVEPSCEVPQEAKDRHMVQDTRRISQSHSVLGCSLQDASGRIERVGPERLCNVVDCRL